MELQRTRQDQAVLNAQTQTWPTVPKTTSHNVLSDIASASAMEVDSGGVDSERTQRAASVLSMDDIEAAQALEGLRTGNKGIPSTCLHPY